MFCKKGVPQNFAKFTRKQMCGSLFFNKLAELETCNIIKTETPTVVYSCKFVKFLKTPIFIEHRQWLLVEEILLFSKNCTIPYKDICENALRTTFIDPFVSNLKFLIKLHPRIYQGCKPFAPENYQPLIIVAKR